MPKTKFAHFEETATRYLHAAGKLFAPPRRWYALDDTDTITRVSSGWSELGDQLTGQTIWNFFSGAATRHIYEKIYQNVRVTRTPASVDIRCDQPDRLVELRVAVSPGEESLLFVHIESLREAPTEYRSIWDPIAVRSGEFVLACSWCQSIHVGDDLWLPFVDAVEKIGLLKANKPPDISHGICDECLARMEPDHQ